jgi:hypothetical protein
MTFGKGKPFLKPQALCLESSLTSHFQGYSLAEKREKGQIPVGEALLLFALRKDARFFSNQAINRFSFKA